MKCINCGAELNEGMTVCPTCGAVQNAGNESSMNNQQQQPYQPQQQYQQQYQQQQPYQPQQQYQQQYQQQQPYQPQQQYQGWVNNAQSMAGVPQKKKSKKLLIREWIMAIYTIAYFVFSILFLWFPSILGIELLLEDMPLFHHCWFPLIIGLVEVFQFVILWFPSIRGRMGFYKKFR